MSKKLFLFDIDGTLYDNKNGNIPQSTIDALRKLSLNHHLGIATGRSEFMLYSIEEIIDLFSSFVLINGQLIKAKGKVIYSDAIKVDDIKNITKQMDELNVIYGYQGSLDEAISRYDEKAKYAFERIGLHFPKIDKDYYLYKDVYQLWALCESEKAKILKDRNPNFQFIKWLDVGYDILPVKANKWKGIERLIAYLGINKDDVIVFGDGDNDFEMLQHAAIGIAMGNATEKAKKHAKYVTTNIDQDGIYNALKYFKFI